MAEKRALIVLDFDGFLVNSYEVIQGTFERLGLDLGDEERFGNRRKFLKYLGGGKELLRNLVNATLPKRGRLRDLLTEQFVSTGRIHEEFVPYLGEVLEDRSLHVGIVSRNFTREPGPTIRAVLANSGIDEHALDFVVPIPIGASKKYVLQALRSSRFERSVLGADEISDYEAACFAEFDPVIASYGFDRRERLSGKGNVPEHVIVDTPGAAVEALRRLTR